MSRECSSSFCSVHSIAKSWRISEIEKYFVSVNIFPPFYYEKIYLLEDSPLVLEENK